MSWKLSLARPRRWLAARPRAALLTRRLVSCSLVGAVAGLGGCLFYVLLQASLALFLGRGAHYLPGEAGGEPSLFAGWLTDVPDEPIRWLLLLLPAFGGLVSGLLVYRFAPEAEGHGTDAAILAFHRLGGRIRPRVPLIKMITAAVTIGTGGSGGREGPIAQIGAGFGSYLAGLLGLPDRERRLLLLAGLGAGVGCIFKAPLAGAIFAAEVLYAEEELEYEALLPATVASIVSYAVFASFFDPRPVFLTRDVGLQAPRELLGYGLLGLVCAAGGWLFVKVFYGARDLFHRLPVPPALRPALGGLLTGLIGFFVPSALATSYGQLQRVLLADPAAPDPTLTVGFLLGLALLKILTTSCSIGSGGSGGVFGPAMVIGGCLGGACGLVCHRFGLVHDPSAMGIVGMAGFFAGAANTPLSTIIMVSEITGNYHLLVPSMTTCAIAAVLLRRTSLYENQVPNRVCSAAHTGELAVDLLQTLRVGDWMNQEQRPIYLTTALPELAVQMADAPHTRSVVITDDGVPRGILDVRDVLCIVAGEGDPTMTAERLMDRHFSTITPDDDLHEALARLDHDAHGMLVVSDAESGRLLGVLRRQDILHAYHEAGQGVLQAVHRAETGALHLPADVTVGEAMSTNYPTVPLTLGLRSLAELFKDSGHHGFPVVSDDGRLCGIVTLTDLERAGHTAGLTTGDIATRRPVTAYPYETLVEALRKFGQGQFGRLPVVDPADPTRLVGVLRRSDVLDTMARSAAVEDAAVIHALDVPRARFVEYTLRRRSPAVGRLVRDLDLPAECLLVSLRRGPALLVPHGETRLEPGDRVTVLCEPAARPAVEQVLGARG